MSGLPHHRAGRLRIVLGWLVLSVAIPRLHTQDAAADPVLAAMKQELNRSFQNLKKDPVPSYFSRIS